MFFLREKKTYDEFKFDIYWMIVFIKLLRR
jgi:hypothetical protein